MNFATRAVRLAVLLLPVTLRERYREQWTSDLRDATEAGLAQSEIAMGALAFAATVSRPLPWSWPTRPAPAIVERRSRLAAALALSAALLGLTGLATIYGTGGLTGTVAYDLLLEVLDLLRVAYMVLAPIIAIVIVTRTRATGTRVRLAVWLLVFPTGSQLAQQLFDSWSYTPILYLLTVGSLAYLIGVVVVIFAAGLLWTALRRAKSRMPSIWSPSIVSALAVLVVGGLASVQAAVAWSIRTPIVWSWQPGYASTMGDDGAVIREAIYPTMADYEQWVAMKVEFEVVANLMLAASGAAAVALAFAVLWVARHTSVRPRSLAAFAIAVLLVANSALLSLLGWSLGPLLMSADLMLAVGRVLVVATVLYGVGHLRFEGGRLARVGHRHDVESRVELL